MKKYFIMCLLASAAMLAFINYKPAVQKQYVINGSIKGRYGDNICGTQEDMDQLPASVFDK